MPSHPRRYTPQTDGLPHRPWSSVNVRPEEKRKLDLIQAWKELDDAQDLTQWDLFSVILGVYVDHAPDLPEDLRRRLRA